MKVARRLGSGWLQAGAEHLLGRLALAAGATTDAERYAHQALGRLAAKNFAIDIPASLDLLAAVAATQESYEEAARLLGAAAAARARLGTIRFPPNQNSGPVSSAPPEKRSQKTATTTPSPRARHWKPTRRSAMSAGLEANANGPPMAGTA